MQKTACVASRRSRSAGRRGSRLDGLLAAAVVLGAVAAMPAAAVQIQGDPVVVPVVVHTDGYNGTQWRSDLWITNTGTPTAALTLTYYPAAGGELTRTFELEGFGGIFLPDVVLETFGLDDSKGMLIVSVSGSMAEVRARIFNTGDPAGEFGQAVMGLPLKRLGRQGFISGASTAAGNRLAVGVANPTDRTITVHIYVKDVITGERFGAEDLTLAPHQLIQRDKVAERWGLPARDALTVNVNSATNEEFFYAYASVVRNDTGDATFIFGTTPNVGNM